MSAKQTKRNARSATDVITKTKYNTLLKDRDQFRRKWQETLKMMEKIKKELTNKLAEKTAEFIKKIKQTEQDAYTAALMSVTKEIDKKEQAKQKLIHATLTKFEKTYHKKLTKNSQKKTAKPLAVKKKESSTKISSKSLTKRRGRPSKREETQSPTENENQSLT